MSKITRRAFVGGTTAGAALWLSRAAHGAARKLGAQDKLNIAGIGVGGMGASNLRALAGENIVALCDVDSEYAVKTFAEYPNAARYRDYRELLAQHQDLDAVVIATPDHTHAVIAAAAMRAGKHVYCQKPLTHTVGEARALAQIAKETGVCSQMGIQGHSGKGARQICEWIWSGAIGPVREVIAWCSLTYYPWGHANWSSPLSARPQDTPPVPETLDWEIWLGPAPARPYHPTYHPTTWRSWWDFGCGMMGDRGAHTLDPIFWALQLDAPSSITASNTDLNTETYPIASIVRYEFPARNRNAAGGSTVELPPLTLTWVDGLQPSFPAEVGDPAQLGDGEGGALLIGEAGMLTCGTYGNSPRLLPEDKFKSYVAPAESLPRIEGSHEMEWANACKGGRPADADFSYSGPLTEVALLGNIAKRFPGKSLQWDAPTMTFPNAPEAAALVNPAYRGGWKL